MNLMLKNQTGGALSYVQGQVTVAANGQTLVPRDYNVLLLGDAGFLSDAQSGNVILNNGSTDMAGPSIQAFAQAFSAFSLTPLATLPLYYSLPVMIRQSAATTAGSVVWSMRNDALSTKIVTIERISLQMGFDSGTPLIRSLQTYGLRRFTVAAPSGGTALTPIAMDTLSPSTFVTDARYLDTGLTITGLSIDSQPMGVVGCPASDGAIVAYERTIPIKLGAGEGLAIVLESAAVTGQDLTGEIVWAER